MLSAHSHAKCAWWNKQNCGIFCMCKVTPEAFWIPLPLKADEGDKTDHAETIPRIHLQPRLQLTGQWGIISTQYFACECLNHIDVHVTHVGALICQLCREKQKQQSVTGFVCSQCQRCNTQQGSQQQRQMGHVYTHTLSARQAFYWSLP